MEQEKYLQMMNKIDDAVKHEPNEPEKARQIYLDTAENLLKEAKIDKEHKMQYLELANNFYEKAKNLDDHKSGDIAPKTAFKDICGLSDLKDEIRLKIIEPLKYPEIFKKFDKKIGGGIIMYGPPGCGKTMIAEAAANESGVKFFNLSAASLRSKYVGESEKNIANIFKEIRKNTPCIVFFDEFENLGEDRNSSTRHSRNEVSQLLQEMDGFGKRNQQVLFIAATNAPWFIDMALRREGRFGSSIFVGTPDYEGRKGMLIKNLIKKPIEEDVDFDALAGNTNYFSGAEIVSICDNAADRVLKEFMKTKKLRKINMKDITDSLTNKKPIAVKWYENAIKTLRNLRDIEFLDVIQKNYDKNEPYNYA